MSVLVHSFITKSALAHLYITKTALVEDISNRLTLGIEKPRLSESDISSWLW